ncbi:TIGR03086 family protein [Cellulomonas sp. zg-ZUI199]|uniref:TIGR03086 family protein n=1 Tax=Cellulomonas wangleii TaxID=2816956 RepID=A0ABX8D3V4_9CELL|nr:TIGR03086 family metal-binding protein [Cellulomonas wangleii]MBO0923831.1 TIGR03086 family protein [Cellulomonas wangleii]MBO0924113.1 TIGR03086 family protein [Cellulomonas wangleii]QVI62138.1 TIGR03086 family protein [Cellulomonas wangleii]
METTSPTFLTLVQPFTGVVDRLPADAWDAPSPCEGWTARDVLRHVVGSQRDFLAGHGVDLPDVDLDADPARGWPAHAAALQDALADPAVVGREYDGWAGRTTVGATLQGFHALDLVVHRWDVATAAGLDERLNDDELTFVEERADALGEALYSDGVCRAGVEPSADADRQARVLARLGR